MSSSLLRQSLDIVDSDNKAKGNKKNRKNKGVFDLIPSNHRNVKSIGKGGKIEKRTVFNIGERTTLKSKDRIRHSSSIIDENLRKLGLLAGSEIKEDIATKIVKRARSGRALVEAEEEEKDEGTVFTEEDFQKFEKDYFCS